MLSVRGLRVAMEGREILKGLDLDVAAGEVHAIMGPNGSGKARWHRCCGSWRLRIISGGVTFMGEDRWRSPEERARAGLFLGFQYPVEIPGVNNAYLLKAALNAVRKARGQSEVDAYEFLALIRGKMALMHMEDSFLQRGVNEGFSGGEKKRNEILQMLVLSRAWPCSTRPTPVSTSMRSRSWPAESRRCVVRIGPSCSSPLPAPARARRARSRARVVRWTDRAQRRRLARTRARGPGLRVGTRGTRRMSSDALRHYATAQAAQTAPGADWIAALRRSGMAAFTSTGFPTSRDEAWKYTSLQALERRRFLPSQGVTLTDSTIAELALPGIGAAARLVFVNGRFIESASTQLAHAGIRVASPPACSSKRPSVCVGDSARWRIRTRIASRR